MWTEPLPRSVPTLSSLQVQALTLHNKASDGATDIALILQMRKMKEIICLKSLKK